jgi:hypothetical protein
LLTSAHRFTIPPYFDERFHSGITQLHEENRVYSLIVFVIYRIELVQPAKKNYS